MVVVSKDTKSKKMRTLSTFAALLATANALAPINALPTQTAAPRAPAPDMRRHDFYQRRARSENGRLRLCVVR